MASAVAKRLAVNGDDKNIDQRMQAGAHDAGVLNQMETVKQ
jgi:hypothetical protein